VLRYSVLVLLLGAAHFSLTLFAPAAAGKAWLLWPFATDTRSWIGAIGPAGGFVASMLAGIAGLGFLAAAASLLGVLIPAVWWQPVVLTASAASALLFVLYATPWAILPVLMNFVIGTGVIVLGWSVTSLHN